jgi:hypothetical protein
MQARRENIGHRRTPVPLPNLCHLCYCSSLFPSTLRLEQSPDEIAEIALIVFDGQNRHINQMLQDAKVGCLG